MALNGRNQMTREVDQQVTVTGSPAALERLLDGMTTHDSPRWSRDKAAESEHVKPFPGAADRYEFTRKVSHGLRPARVSMTYQRTGELFVCDVRPLDGMKMNVMERNAALADFVESLLSPIAEREGAHIALESATPGLGDWMSTDTAEKLRIFSELANKAVLHALDSRRWIDFVFAAHSENAELTTFQLEQWLRDNGWGIRDAERMATRYGNERELLRAYDRLLRGENPHRQ